jgi:hypothetical protein
MPVNYQQIRDAIQKAGSLAPLRDQELRDKREQALALLMQFAPDPQPLIQKAQTALERNPDFRCGLPTRELLNLAHLPTTPLPQAVLWGADGSQIIPDQHLAVQFGVINVGLIRLASGAIPRQEIESELLYADDIYTPQGYLVGEEIIALRRDYKERTHLLDAALQDPAPVLTLTDGPLELYREGKESREYQVLLENYLGILSQMADANVLTAGYVDKPRADLLIRFLELALLTPEQLNNAGQIRPLGGITDAELFAELLQPGQRSAVIVLQSRSSKRFSGRLAIHCFYLNTGRDQHPQIARVEIPGWVAQDAAQVDLVQQHILDQCYQMGVKAYPYILHRAHETALVSYEERDRLMNMIQIELLNRGVQPGEISSKQHHKDQPGKTRYGK